MCASLVTVACRRARNLGVSHAKSDLLFILDADNPRRASEEGWRTRTAMEEEPGAGFAYGMVQ